MSRHKNLLSSTVVICEQPTSRHNTFLVLYGWLTVYTSITTVMLMLSKLLIATCLTVAISFQALIYVLNHRLSEKMVDTDQHIIQS